MTETLNPFEGWAILELMGRFRTAGRITEETHFGGALGRCDVPNQTDQGFTTIFFRAESVYRLTPCSEEAARAVAAHTQPEPVYRYELAAPTSPVTEVHVHHYPSDDEDAYSDHDGEDDDDDDR